MRTPAVLALALLALCCSAQALGAQGSWTGEPTGQQAHGMVSKRVPELSSPEPRRLLGS